MYDPRDNRPIWDWERDQYEIEPLGKRVVTALIAVVLFAVLYGIGWVLVKHGDIAAGAGLTFLDWLFDPRTVLGIFIAGFFIWFVTVQSRTARAVERTAKTLDDIKRLLERDDA
jgi:chromate transport protein ChrA